MIMKDAIRCKFQGRYEMTVAEIIQQAQTLSLQERTELVKLLIDSLVNEADTGTKPHSILELAGLGEDIWKGIDAQNYVDQLRSEWDDRP
jgi:hypothetical protein